MKANLFMPAGTRIGDLLRSWGRPLLYFTLAGLVVFALSPSKASLSAPTKAIYLWTYSPQVLRNVAEQARFFKIACEEKINTVYIQLNGPTRGFLGGAGEEFRWFIAWAKCNGIEVHALISGTASVLDNPEAHRSCVEAILKYNLENPDNRFAGINWDIEPVNNQAPRYTTYMKEVKAFSYLGQTIVSQGLVLSAYLDAPRWLGHGAAGLYREFDIIALNSYGDTIEEVMARAADGPDTFEEAGIDFLIGLETDEIPNHVLTLFEEGKDAYQRLADELDGYFSGKYTRYAGQYVHHYDKAISWWHMIVFAWCPSGFYRAGSVLFAQVMLKRNDSYSDAPIGVKLTVRGDDTTWNTSKIIVLGGTEMRGVYFLWLVPEDGEYRTEISTWDLDLGVHGSRLLEDGFSGDKTSLEALTMGQLARMDVPGKRNDFVLLENTSGEPYVPALLDYGRATTPAAGSQAGSVK